MVDRIDKTDRVEEYWKIDSSAETYKDKQQGENEGNPDAFASLSEKTDWKLLFDKSQLWKKNIQVLKEEIKQVVFRKLNLKTDPSLLRIDVELISGEKISPAFLAISRYAALQLKNLKSGDPIPESSIMPDSAVLHITIPSNPELFTEEERLLKQKNLNQTTELTVKSNLSAREIKSWGFSPKKRNVRLEVALTYGVIALTLILAIGGYFLVKYIR